jgi:DEAD/DEAH box helicase domain-containing protein
MDRFESTQPDAKNDVYAADRSRYESTRRVLEKLPYWRQYQSPLMEAKNSMERLLWQLAHPLNEQQASNKKFLAILLRQEEFGRPAIDAAVIDQHMDPRIPLNPDIRAENTAAGNFYVFPETGLRDANFAQVRLAIRLKDLDVRVALSAVTLPEESLDRDEWEKFWQLFNLLQIQAIMN